MSGQEIKHKCYNIAPAVSATKNKAEEVDTVGRNDVLVYKRYHLNRPEKRGKLSYDGTCRGRSKGRNLLGTSPKMDSGT